MPKYTCAMLCRPTVEAASGSDEPDAEDRQEERGAEGLLLQPAGHPLAEQAAADQQPCDQQDDHDHARGRRRGSGESLAQHERGQHRDGEERAQRRVARVGEDPAGSLPEVGEGQHHPGRGGEDRDRVADRRGRAQRC
jgi:hypothetical protein